MTVDTYYFDGHISTGDPDSAWSNDANLFDGSTATNSVTNSTGDTTSNFITGTGTTAGTSYLGKITQVRARIYGGSAGADWGSYVTLSAPSGGWTWGELSNGLSVRVYADSIPPDEKYILASFYDSVSPTPLGTAEVFISSFFGTYNAYRVEVEVTYDETIKVGGPNIAGVGTNDSAVGSVAWSNPSNITADDGSFAESANGAFDGGADIQDYVISLILADGTISSTNKSTGAYWPTGSFAYSTYGSSSDLWGETWTAEDINDANFGVVVQTRASITPPSSTSQLLKASDFGFTIPTGSTIDGITVEVDKMQVPGNFSNALARVDAIRVTITYTEPADPTYLTQQNGRLLLQEDGRALLI